MLTCLRMFWPILFIFLILEFWNHSRLDHAASHRAVLTRQTALHSRRLPPSCLLQYKAYLRGRDSSQQADQRRRLILHLVDRLPSCLQGHRDDEAGLEDHDVADLVSSALWRDGATRWCVEKAVPLRGCRDVVNCTLAGWQSCELASSEVHVDEGCGRFRNAAVHLLTDGQFAASSLIHNRGTVKQLYEDDPAWTA